MPGLRLRGPERWTAYWLTLLFMAAWFWTPIGRWETDLLVKAGALFANTAVGDLGPVFAQFAWPVTGLAFFVAARTIFRRRTRVAVEEADDRDTHTTSQN